MATERELKFSTADDHVPSTLELELALEGSGLAVTPGKVSRHVDLYFDSEAALAAAGMALRLRRSSTGSWVTLKAAVAEEAHSQAEARSQAPRSAADAMQRRTELELQLDEAPAVAASAAGAGVPVDEPGTGSGAPSAWPEPVLAALPPGLSVEGLAPVAELHIRRVAFLIVPGSDSPDNAADLAELAFDEVTAVAQRAPGTPAATATAEFHEVEIEWLGADDAQDPVVLACLTTVAEAVGTIVTLVASPVPKLARARALLATLADG